MQLLVHIFSIHLDLIVTLQCACRRNRHGKIFSLFCYNSQSGRLRIVFFRSFPERLPAEESRRLFVFSTGSLGGRNWCLNHWEQPRAVICCTGEAPACACARVCFAQHCELVRLTQFNCIEIASWHGATVFFLEFDIVNFWLDWWSVH